MTDAITRAAHAICRERCFMFGNYPCSPKSHCRVSSSDQPSCLVLAKAALAATAAQPDATAIRLAVIMECLTAVQSSAWEHGDDDSFSRGMDAGAIRQSKTDFAAIFARIPTAPDAVPHDRRSPMEHWDGGE